MTTKAAKKKVTPKAKTVQIVYSCGPLCKAQAKHPRIKNGSTVVLKATNTDVDISFTNGSPFKSHDTTIHIAQGTTKSEVIQGTTGKEYFYTLTCADCSNPVDSPSMIVD
jgi:hypothetical protein